MSDSDAFIRPNESFQANKSCWSHSCEKRDRAALRQNCALCKKKSILTSIRRTKKLKLDMQGFFFPSYSRTFSACEVVLCASRLLFFLFFSRMHIKEGSEDDVSGS